MVSLLRNLDTEENKFYESVCQLYCAALLTRRYTKHTLRPYIDSEMYHIRYLIKVQCVNKGINYINLPSIFKDKAVIKYIIFLLGITCYIL